jgi:hypothetical protein
VEREKTEPNLAGCLAILGLNQFSGTILAVLLLQNHLRRNKGGMLLSVCMSTHKLLKILLFAKLNI